MNRRRLTRHEMRVILGIERNLDDRRGLHLRPLPADIRRDIRESWKRLVVEHMVDQERRVRRASHAMSFFVVTAESLLIHAKNAWTDLQPESIRSRSPRFGKCFECHALGPVERCRDEDELANFFCPSCRDAHGLRPVEAQP